MSRRGFFAFMAAAAAAMQSTKAAFLGWGCIDVPRHVVLRHQGFWLRVFFNGEDVTNRCVEADDQMGTVILFQRNAQGQFYIDYSKTEPEVAREFKHGRVKFKRTEPWA